MRISGDVKIGEMVINGIKFNADREAGAFCPRLPEGVVTEITNTYGTETFAGGQAVWTEVEIRYLTERESNDAFSEIMAAARSRFGENTCAEIESLLKNAA